MLNFKPQWESESAAMHEILRLYREDLDSHISTEELGDNEDLYFFSERGVEISDKLHFEFGELDVHKLDRVYQILMEVLRNRESVNSIYTLTHARPHTDTTYKCFEKFNQRPSQTEQNSLHPLFKQIRL